MAIGADWEEIGADSTGYKRRELEELAELLRPRELGAVLEVVIASSVTLRLWSELAHEHALLCSVALELRGEARDFYSDELPAGQRLRRFQGDSHDPALQARVAAFCGHRLDLLFLDGDRSYAGLLADLRAYAPLLRPGGLLVLHDAFGNAHPGPRECWAERNFWRATLGLPPIRDSWAIFDRSRSWGGFGVIEFGEISTSPPPLATVEPSSSGTP